LSARPGEAENKHSAPEAAQIKFLELTTMHPRIIAIVPN
jgi:hypothetical protein